MVDVEDEDEGEGGDEDEDGGCGGREEMGLAPSDGIFDCDDDMADD